MELRQSGERVAHLSCREHDRDPLRQQAAGNERERPRGRAIEPLRVIDEQSSGRSSAASDSNPSTASPTRNVFGADPALSPKATATASRWGSGRRFHEVEHRRAQLLKRGVRELHLPIDPRGPEGPEVSRVLKLVLEDGGLADARLAVDDQDTATPAAHRVKQPVDRFELPFPAEEPAAWRPDD